MKRIFLLCGVIILAVFILFGAYLNANYATPILVYHSLDGKRAENYAAVDIKVFRRQMEFIKRNSYKVISLDRYCRLLRSGEAVPRRSLIITFDDGYKDNLEGIKTLKESEFPATIFIIVDKVGKEGYLSEEDIKSFLGNSQISIGSHTLTHAYLPGATVSELKKEIAFSKEILEKNFPQTVSAIAYPVGGFDERVLREAEAAGYLCACSTNRGFSKRINPFALRRIKITNSDGEFSLWAKLSGFYNVFRKLKNPY
ncbi:MAG: polysaccharide deacetylase family protein [Candidatus Omnitrophica bacterium]|nr:polysaccharide deacetylase family protein [Candidatus Omnitrophota bacterium]MDD5429114.1 polysaccharide deacetylase family protein [Candidatus Omnitrophota bacterium]